MPAGKEQGIEGREQQSGLAIIPDDPVSNYPKQEQSSQAGEQWGNDLNKRDLIVIGEVQGQKGIDRQDDGMDDAVRADFIPDVLQIHIFN